MAGKMVRSQINPMEANMKKMTLTSGAIALAAATLMSGCVVAPEPVHYRPVVVYPEAPPPPVVVNIAPPAPQVEVIPPAPVPNYFWIGGVWIWEGNHHVWHPGHWEAPRPGYAWVPHHWHETPNGWMMEGGHWRHN
jgi:hypothetical protein